jgi:hypothetical protein
MAASVTSVIRTVPGSDFKQVSTIVGDTSYPNPAGYVLTPDQFGLKVIRRIGELRPNTVAAAVWTPVLVKTFNADGSIATLALHFVVATTGVEVANAVNLSTASFEITVEGN